VCLTGEDQPDPTQKLNQLRGVLASYGGPEGAVRAQPTLTQQIASNLKILLELHGDALNSQDRQYIEGLYTQLPLSFRTDCGSGEFVPPSGLPPFCSATTRTIDGGMEMCSRMRAGHASIASVKSVFSDCLNVVDGIKNLPTQCGKDEYLKDYVSLAENLTSKQMSFSVASAGTTDQLNEISAKLTVIDSWFRKVQQSVYPQYPLADDLLAQTSRVLRAFWEPLYLDKAASLQVGSTADQAETARQQVVSDGLTADKQVLKAAYGAAGPPPITSAPLVSLTADALKGIDQRALSTATMHDMACRFDPTCAGRTTSTSAFLQLLGSISSKDQLTAALTDKAMNAIGQDWSAVFNAINTGHAALESAIVNAGIPNPSNTDKPLLTLSLGQLSVPAQSLANIVRGAHARSNAYNANGLFTLTKINDLNVGLDSDKDNAVVAELSRVTTLLNQQVHDYRANKLMLVQGFVSQIQNQSTSNSLSNNIQISAQKIVDLTSDLSGLQTTSAVDDARYGQFMKDFEDIWAAIHDSGRPILVSQDIHDIDVSAADASANPDRSSILNLAVTRNGKAWTFSKQPGDIVNFSISGRWAPNCALGQTPVIPPPTTGATVRVNDSQGQPIYTGPEGYSVQQQSGSYCAQSNQTVDTLGQYASASLSAEACAGTPGQAVTGSGVKVCIDASIGMRVSQDQSSTDSRGSEVRSTFSYARGIRSPLAPFPNQPVGSLLLVEMPQGSIDISLATGVRVLIAPQTSLLVSAASDYYLVVNDTSCKQPAPDSLAVRVSELTAAGTASRNMAQAMAAIPDLISQQAGPIVAQGRVLPDQINLIRQDAYQKLYDKCGCTSLSDYPDSLKNLFETYVEKELVGIQREVEMVNIERQVRETMMEVQTLQNELDHTQSVGRLSALIPAWALRNLDGDQLQVSLDSLTQLIRDWVYPIIALRNPDTLTQNDLAPITQLTNIGVSDNLDDKAQSAIDAANSIYTLLSRARIAEPKTFSTVIFSIPKPGTTSPTSFWKIDAQTAAAFWKDISSNQNTTFTIQPEYIYTNTSPNFLPCHYSAPIIDSVVLYLVYPTPMAYVRNQLTATLSSELRFPLTAGLSQYQFVDSAYLGPLVDVLGGASPSTISDEIEKYWAEPGRLTQTVTGLSPFTDWYLDLTPFRNAYPSDKSDQLATTNPWYQAVELLVAFRVEPRSEAPGKTLPGVPTCAP
jgi:hypothetical protein